MSSFAGHVLLGDRSRSSSLAAGKDSLKTMAKVAAGRCSDPSHPPLCPLVTLASACSSPLTLDMPVSPAPHAEHDVASRATLAEACQVDGPVRGEEGTPPPR